MVFDDQSNQKNQNEVSLQNRFATPVDRLLAKFFDFIFLSPLLALLIEINKYLFSRDKLNLENSSFVNLVNLQTVIFTIFVYQILCIYKFQATVGQKILKIKVIKIDQTALSFKDVWIRQISWYLNFLFFGIPFLEILSHKKRQSIHDRLSETLVVSETSSFSSAHFLEADLVKTAYRLTILFSVFVVLALNFYLYDAMMGGKSRSQSDLKCFNFNDKNSSYADLDKKLSAFYLGLNSKDCVYQSLNQELLEKEVDQDLVLIAQYFLHDDKKVRERYRNSLCKNDCAWIDNASKAVEIKLPLFSKIYKYKTNKFENLDQKIAEISGMKLPIEFNGQLFEELLNKEQNIIPARSPAGVSK